MIALYRPGASPIHRLPAGWKLAALALAGTGLMLVDEPAALGVALAAAVVLYRVAELGIGEAARQIRPLLPILVLLAVVQGLVVSREAGAALALRFAALILLAGLVTLTTPVSALVAALERGLAPLRPLGVSPVRVAFALALAIRFVPVIAETATAIREAQAARGRAANPLALAVPLVIRTLAAADAVAEAVEARGGLPEDPGRRARAAPVGNDELTPGAPPR